MASVKLTKINKLYGQVHILKDIDLDIQDGEFVVFVGPSGCGKSTLLRVIAGLEEINSGDLHIGGQLVNELTPKERGIGMVFQSYALYPHMTVYENIAFGLELAKGDKQSIAARVEQTARILQLENLLQRKPRALSGGQRQRVAMGRAIAREPRVMLFDEPLSNLDAALRVQMRMEISKLHRRLGSTMIYVTHDQVEAMTLANKIVVLNAGRVEQVGSPYELYEHPASLFVAGFIGSPKMNLLPGQLQQGQVQVSGLGGVPVHVRQQGYQGTVTLGIRPEHLSISPSDTGVGEIVNLEYLGNERFVYVAIPQQEEPILARDNGKQMLELGQTVELHWSAADCHLFDADGKAFQRTAVEQAPATNAKSA